MLLDRYKYFVFGVLLMALAGSAYGGAGTGSQDEGPYLALPESAGVPAFKHVASHIPRAMRAMTDNGKVAGDSNLTVTVALGLNNQADLDKTLSGLYDPSSPSYGHYLTPQQFRARYAPTADQIAQVQAYLISQGLTPMSVNDNKMFIRANGSASAIAAAFHTELHNYTDSKGASYYGPAYELQLPKALPIVAVHGLQDFSRWRHSSVRLSKPNQEGPPPGGLTPDQVHEAYNIPTSLNGTGQTLGLLELDGYDPSDITTYEQKYGLPNVTLQNIQIDGADGSAGQSTGEVCLDLELQMAIAPGISKILVYESTQDSQGILDGYSKIANDNLAKSISTSWGQAEDLNDSSFMQSENTVFKQMAAQGQSIYAAAGDNGADDDGSQLSVDDPAAQPYVTGVGGTVLTTNADGSYGSETAWGDGTEQEGGGGGGGVSTVWALPDWQKGLSTSVNQVSSTMRNVPDVSLDAAFSTGYNIYTQGQWGMWGGTSCASPIWAAFTALVNQQRATNGLGALGYANPALYKVAGGPNYDNDFHDIKDGSTNGQFPAEAGYDDATGWGSFNAQNLLNDLSKQ